MIILDLLEEQNMTRYKLSKTSGVAMTTINDICSGKTDLEKCTAGNLYKIAKTLDVPMDYILEKNNEHLKRYVEGITKHNESKE